ncbi:MAG: hypothetical protein HYS38_02775, partial [Acidobacteria bacterium]|nr:hypothetical protein [Acidobacteriota bacterium]
LAALVLLLAQAAGAQEEDIVKFREQNAELQGAIFMVEPQNNLLIVEKNSIPYSFQVTSATRVMVSNQKTNLENLAARKGQGVTIKFRVTRKGNLAQEIVVP